MNALFNDSTFFDSETILLKGMFISHSKNVVNYTLSNLNGIAIIKWYLSDKPKTADKFLPLNLVSYCISCFPQFLILKYTLYREYSFHTQKMWKRINDELF